MKLTIVIVAVLAIVSAEEGDANNKKRGVPKTSPINSIASNPHHKPEQLTYVNYQQQQQQLQHQQTQTATQSPLYPLAPTYTTTPEQQPTQQPSYNFLPQTQMLTLPILMQPSVTPKFQIIAMKTANGQTQLTLVPQNLYYTPQNFASPSSNYQQSSASPNSYLPQQSYVQSQASTQQTQSPLQSFYQNLPLSFGQNPVVQPSMYFLAQPSPQLYNNYLSPQYNPTQQLINYYQSNPQAKNQLLYGSAQGSYQQGINSYQSPVSSEYEKNIPGQVQSSKNDNELNLNTNEYIASAESQFRPIPSYGSRGHSSYKH